MNEQANFIEWNGYKFRITKFRMMLTAIVIIGMGVIAIRLITGFSLVTNINDTWPWGLWIAFDVFTGVALAGGGYSTAFLLHILGREQYKSLARCSLLVSLMGYIWVMMAEILDIGQWLNFWRPFVSWGHNSVLFEIFWCIMIYTNIQILEFSEIVTEKKLTFLNKYIKKAMPVLLILGVLFPTFHQASLGGLFLIAKAKMSALWWSEYIPVFFLLSSFFVGPATVCVINWFTRRSFKNNVPVDVLTDLARVGGRVMIVYLILKMADIAARGQFGTMFAFSLESLFYLSEIFIGVLLPIIVVFSRYGRCREGLLVYGLLTCAGLIMNRMNTVFTSMYGVAQSIYIPSIWEFVVTISICSISVLIFCFLADNFNIMADDEVTEEAVEVLAVESSDDMAMGK